MRYFLVLLFITVLFSSCNFKEEVTFKGDGSGDFMVTYDLSEVMQQLKQMGMSDPEKEQKHKKIDSTIYFKEMLELKADSISKLPQEEQEKLKSLEPIVVKINMDSETEAFNFAFGSSFKDINALPEVFQKIQDAKQFNTKANAQYSKLNESAVAKSAEGMFNHIDFSFDGKTFMRQLKEGYTQAEGDIAALDNEINQMGEMKALFEAMSYTIVYHFPKKIKSVSNKNAKLSNNDKTVTLKVNFIDMVKAPETTNLKVELK